MGYDFAKQFYEEDNNFVEKPYGKSTITVSVLSENLLPKKWKNIFRSICRTKLQEQQKRHSSLLHRFNTTIFN